MNRLSACCVLSILILGACRPPQAVAQRQRAERERVLDSLAGTHPCRRGGYRVLAPATWTRAHACAVAERGVELLAAAPPNEPHFAPGDSARIRAVSVGRIQTCEIDLTPPFEPGRITPMWYGIEIDVPERPRFIAITLDARTLMPEHGVSVVHKGFDGSDTLMVGIEGADTLEIGGPCG